MKFLKSVAVLMLVALAACGPADVNQAANEAATTVGGALPSLPPGAEATAAAALNDQTAQAALATAQAAARRHCSTMVAMPTCGQRS